MVLNYGPGGISGRAVVQNVVADANNSSNAALNAGASFIGIATSTLGVVGLQVSLRTDQNCVVNVEQSPDGNFWDITDTYNYYASIGNFGITIQAVNSFLRVRVTNISLVNQTFLRLQTCLCPIVEAVPRSLDPDGHFKVAIQSTQDKYGFLAENTPMGDLRSVIPTRLVGAAFVGTTLDGNFWSTTGTAAGGTVTIPVGAECVLRTNGAANGTAILTSTRMGRYIGGNANRYRAVVRLPDAGAASNIRRWGAFDANNGAFFELNGAAFRVVTRKGGIDTPVPSGNFNGALGATFLPGTNVRTYEIYWTNSRVWFGIGDEMLHTVSAATATWADTTVLPVRGENANSGGAATDLQLLIRTNTIYRLGPAISRPQFRYQSGAADVILKYGPGTLHRVVLNQTGGTTVTLYDNVAGVGSPICILNPGGSPLFVEYGLDFYTGLHMVTVGVGINCTVVYE